MIFSSICVAVDRIFVTVTVLFIVSFLINIKLFFEHLVVSLKRNKRPVSNKRPPSRYQQ